MSSRDAPDDPSDRMLSDAALVADGGEDRPRTGADDTDGHGGQPRINPDFPIESADQLSPPFIHPPLYVCAEAVFVSGFVPRAIVRVFADGTQVGEAHPHFGYVSVSLDRPLEEGEEVTATQEVDGVESAHSPVPVEVEPFEGSLHAPRISKDCFECGRVVAVDDVIPGSRVEVYEDGSLVGSEDASTDYSTILVDPLTAGEDVTARLVRCPNGPGDEVEGPPSEPETVQPEPSPVRAPSVVEPEEGNDVVTLRDLYPGAGVEIEDRGTPVIPGSYYANDTSNWFPVEPPVGASSEYTAWQELCDPSPTSDPVPSVSEPLDPPTVRPPICPHSRHVRVADTVVNATVVLFVDGSIAGYGGARDDEVVLTVGGGNRLRPGQQVRALQYMGSRVSPKSAPVPVGQRLPGTPSVEVRGGRTLLDPGTEELFTAFVREDSSGVTVRVLSCCEEGGRAIFVDPSGREVAEVELEQIYPGYQEAKWNWARGEDVDPHDLEPGTYTVRVETECEQRPGEAEFEVVIGEPDRDDATPPGVTLEATLGGRTYSRSDTHDELREVTIERSGSVDIDVSVLARDDEGLRRVELSTSGVPSSASVVGSTTYTNPGSAPIPTEHSLDPVVRNVEPPATVVLRGEAENFSSDPAVAERSTPDLVFTVERPPEPPSVSLSVEPDLIGPGSSADLRWNSSHADSLDIDHGIGSVSVPSGRRTVGPPDDRTYQITATGPGGTATDTASLRVENVIRQTTTLTLSYIGRQYVPRGSGYFDIFEQTDPLSDITDTGALHAITLYPDLSSVTGITNRSLYRTVVYHSDGRTWQTSNPISPGSSSNDLNGRRFVGEWEMYMDPIDDPPLVVNLDVDWELSL